MSDYDRPSDDGRFPEELRVKAPRGACQAIDLVAERKHTSRSEYVRQAVLTRLEADGVRLQRGQVVAA
jgi:metal-responsive CopG/Arc/MetJ family transcriptional regulator